MYAKNQKKGSRKTLRKNRRRIKRNEKEPKNGETGKKRLWIPGSIGVFIIAFSFERKIVDVQEIRFQDYKPNPLGVFHKKAISLP